MGALDQASECVKRAVVTVRNRAPREKQHPKTYPGTRCQCHVAGLRSYPVAAAGAAVHTVLPR
eukprot:3940699-Rhodomonas_salina.7